MVNLSGLNPGGATNSKFLTRQPKQSANDSKQSDRYREMEVDIEVVSYAPDYSAVD